MNPTTSFPMIATTTSVKKAKLFFPAQTLNSSSPNSNSKPLTIAEFLVVDATKQRIDVLKVLGFPSDQKPGTYDLEVEPRPKSGKSGINYWYVSAKPVQQ